MIFLVALLGGLILLAVLVIGAIRLERARRTARDLAEEDTQFDAYLREVGWNQTGEQVE